MIWIRTFLLFFVGLIVAGPLQNVQAGKFFNLNARNFTHGIQKNKTTNYYSNATPAIIDNVLYRKYACQGKPDRTRLSIEGSCTQFLECRYGLSNLMTCKPGYHFSALGMTCIDEKLSKCSVKCECCGKKDGLYPDETNCSNFVICSKGKAHYQACGSTLKFNSQKLICDVPQRVQCFESSTSNNTYIKPGNGTQSGNLKVPMYLVSHEVCRNKSNGYTIGIQGSCNKFYLCINGKGFLKSCGHLQFNAQKHHCDGSKKIFCPIFGENEEILDSDQIQKPWFRPESPTDVPQPPHRVPGNPLGPSIAGKPNHENSVPHTPATFEKPGSVLPQNPPNQESMVVPQPPVIVVDPIKVPPTIVVPADVEIIIDSKEYAGLCVNQSIGALIPMPNHCNKYIRCKWDWIERRVAVLESCPKGKHFNIKSKVCDKPAKAGCIFRSIKQHF